MQADFGGWEPQDKINSFYQFVTLAVCSRTLLKPVGPKVMAVGFLKFTVSFQSLNTAVLDVYPVCASASQYSSAGINFDKRMSWLVLSTLPLVTCVH